MKTWRIALIAGALLAGSTTAANAALHAGDRVQISVYNHPELSTQATVDSRGRISMALAGDVIATGASEKELAVRIQDRLQQYMRYPAVDVVLLSQSTDIFVSGGPGGTLQYRPGDTLGTALNDLQVQCKCSLKDTSGDLDHVKIVRDGIALGPYDAQTMTESGETGPALEPGDRIAFENKPVQVMVRGAVQSPGTAYLAADQPLSAALTQVGGMTQNASYAQIILNRGGTLTQISEGSPEFSMPARPGDILTVPSQEHVQVIGAVNSQGEVTLKQDFTLLSALYYAGGPNRWADLRKVMVRHRGETHVYDVPQIEHGDLSQNPAIEDGDVVFVPEGHKIDWRSFFQTLTWGRWLFPKVP